MWLHICLLAGTLVLAVLAGMGSIPHQDVLTVREWRLLILLLAAGNCLGAWMTYTQNKGRQWETGMYFEKQEAGEGSYEEEMHAQVKGEETAVTVRIPEQEGEGEPDEGQLEEEAVREKALDERIGQAVEEYNSHEQAGDRYYLPAELDGDPVIWSRAWDSSGNIVAALCVIGACCIPIQKQKDKGRKRQERSRQLLLDYPDLVTRLTLLLEAGMTVRRAFGKIALSYKRKKGAGGVRYAYEELLRSYYEMESGVMEEKAYEDFGKRCGHPKYRTLAALLVQNLRRGDQRLLATLEREAESAFEERKRNARVQGEEAATKLLIPMALMLLIVLVLLIVPACMSFYQM